MNLTKKRQIYNEGFLDNIRSLGNHPHVRNFFNKVGSAGDKFKEKLANASDTIAHKAYNLDTKVHQPNADKKINLLHHGVDLIDAFHSTMTGTPPDPNLPISHMIKTGPATVGHTFSKFSQYLRKK